MTAAMREEILAQLGRLSEDSLRKAKVTLQRLEEEDRAERERRWCEVVGSISDEDAAQMLKVIEEEFERIDDNRW